MIEILRNRVPPLRPPKPNWFINVGLASILGLVIGLGSAFFPEFVGPSFRSVDDMERRLLLSILGVVTRNLVNGAGGKNYGSLKTEPYRVIRTNLGLSREMAVETYPHFNRWGPGKGKSTTLYNLAATIAISGQKVLVIDSVLRRFPPNIVSSTHLEGRA